ncbi:LuxR family two component transcriptional regulator [Thermosporothrix hazakensis]|jgi:DNA-binding NarL/FixJ family response regulator|uniref:LuxR family two component transcriptional regulator n=2 Tax=Thermosporothrix TaxID=768650 RepID=A0A326U2Y4_THEHA|nr:response regulator transcription factor [Thermosporothrix hazakensis]PZW24854.1 LuxR family two component transcriptional regulator [Thermosporothrix hazakensis]BBH88270.1 DNA-binding response regulator [Thermosporothrix sp. COM3]GCE46457.1 DNA-binding response regulator [Thermosporothrix hazakensis]
MTTEAKSIRVLLADDHDILRQGLTLLLKAQPDMTVVGEARNGIEAVEQATRLHPDVVVLDISMSKMDGMEACQRIRALLPATQVLILTMHESEEYFLQALRMGAAGYIVKKAAPADLCNAVRTIAHGGAFLYPGLAKALIREYLSPETSRTLPEPNAQDRPNPLKRLTARELEVLTLVAEGLTNQQIADRLVISIKTVQAHRANMMEKLGLADITQVVRFAIQHKLISAEW